LRVELAYTGASARVIYAGWTPTPIIDVAFGGRQLPTQMNATAWPPFLREPITPASLAKAIVPGMAERHARTGAPQRWLPLFWLRGVANPATDWLLTRHGKLQALIAELDKLTAANVRRLDTARRQRAARKNTEK